MYVSKRKSGSEYKGYIMSQPQADIIKICDGNDLPRQLTSDDTNIYRIQ